MACCKAEDPPPAINPDTNERDYSTMEGLKLMPGYRPYKFIDSKCFFQGNWVVTLLASAFLWIWIGIGLARPCYFNALIGWGGAMSWVAQNFTWFYIGTNDAWAVFLIWLYMSKYSDIKLGPDKEEPEFSFFAWFTMQLTCGVAVGMYTWGVAEPMYYYRKNGALFKVPMANDDDRAQQAMFVTLFHWGLHAYVVYSLCAVAIAVVAYKKNLPLTFKMAFEPLLGDLVHSFLGDIIDAMAISCTTFGVCTSLGMGVDVIDEGFGRINEDYGTGLPAMDRKIMIVIFMTVIANLSVLIGVKGGLDKLSMVAFYLGTLYILITLLHDNTWFLLNNIVQSVGHYLQYVVMVGFQCDTFQQLQFEFSPSGTNYNFAGAGINNLYWGSDGGKDVGGSGPGMYQLFNHSSLVSLGLSKWVPDGSFPSCGMEGEWQSTIGKNVLGNDTHYRGFMDYWTIFYWGWWISWCPFVGMFIAKISRGRTIRQVIMGTMTYAISYVFVWLLCTGGAGVRMERTAEIVLGSTVDYRTGSLTDPEGGDPCGVHYHSGGSTTDMSDVEADYEPGKYQIPHANSGDIFGRNGDITTCNYYGIIENKLSWVPLMGDPVDFETQSCTMKMEGDEEAGNLLTTIGTDIERTVGVPDAKTGLTESNQVVTYTPNKLVKFDGAGYDLGHMTDPDDNKVVEIADDFNYALDITDTNVIPASYQGAFKEELFNKFNASGELKSFNFTFNTSVDQAVIEVTHGQGYWRYEGSWGAFKYLPYRPAANKTICSMRGRKSGVCSGQPKSEKATKMYQAMGIKMLKCQGNAGMGFDVLDSYAPEGPVRTFYYLIFVVGLCIYFITSSDSGSWCDDTNSSGGILEPPKLQKCYWCWTECFTAIALLSSGDKALVAIRAVSTVSGFPWTLALCFMCTSLLRAVKEVKGEIEPIGPRTGWASSMLDFFESFDFLMSLCSKDLAHNGHAQFLGLKGSPFTFGQRLISIMLSIFCPFVITFQIAAKAAEVAAEQENIRRRAVKPIPKLETAPSKLYPAAMFLLTFGGFVTWITLLAIDNGNGAHYANMGWIFGYFTMMMVAFFLRMDIRKNESIPGSYAEDFFGALVFLPFSLSQMHLQVVVGFDKTKMEKMETDTYLEMTSTTKSETV